MGANIVRIFWGGTFDPFIHTYVLPLIRFLRSSAQCEQPHSNTILQLSSFKFQPPTPTRPLEIHTPTIYYNRFFDHVTILFMLLYKLYEHAGVLLSR